jgi:hypothetical protein
VLKDQGKYEQAEETYRQALRLIETVLGKDVEKAAGKRSLNRGLLHLQFSFEAPPKAQTLCAIFAKVDWVPRDRKLPLASF